MAACCATFSALRLVKLRSLQVCVPRQESQRLDTEITQLSTTARDCGLLMPDGSPDQQARIAALTATLRRGGGRQQ